MNATWVCEISRMEFIDMFNIFPINSYKQQDFLEKILNVYQFAIGQVYLPAYYV